MVEERDSIKEALKEAIEYNKVKQLQKLLEGELLPIYVATPDFFAGEDKLFDLGVSPITVAIEKRHMKVAEILLDHILLNFPKERYRHLLQHWLILAAQENQVSMVKKLLDSGLQVSLKAYQEAGWMAARHNALDVVSVFLSRRDKTGLSNTFIKIVEGAAIGGHVQIVKRCLEKKEVKAALKGVFQRDEEKSLILAAVNGGSVEILNLLLDVDKRFDRLVLPKVLFSAVEHGNLEMVNRILDFPDIGHQIIEAKLAFRKDRLNRENAFFVDTRELTEIMYLTGKVKVSMQEYEEIQKRMICCDDRDHILATPENRACDDRQEKNWSDLEKGDVSTSFQRLVKLVLEREQTRWYLYRKFVIELLIEAADHEHEAVFDCLMKRTEGYDASLDHHASVLRAALRRANLAITNTLLSIKEVSESTSIFKGLFLASVETGMRYEREEKVIAVLKRLFRFPKIWGDGIYVISVLREAVSCGRLDTVRLLLEGRSLDQQQIMIQSKSMGDSTFDRAVDETQSGAVAFFNEVLAKCPPNFDDDFKRISGVKESSFHQEETNRLRFREKQKKHQMQSKYFEWRFGSNRLSREEPRTQRAAQNKECQMQYRGYGLRVSSKDFL